MDRKKENKRKRKKDERVVVVEEEEEEEEKKRKRELKRLSDEVEEALGGYRVAGRSVGYGDGCGVGTSGGGVALVSFNR